MVIMWKDQNIKKLLQKYTLQIGLKMFFWLKKLKKKLKKTNHTELGQKKVIKKKVDKLYVKWKGYDNSFNLDW